MHSFISFINFIMKVTDLFVFNYNKADLDYRISHLNFKIN
jgi:hypothetical protein